MIPFLWLLILTLFHLSNAHAIINVESVRMKPSGPGFRQSLSLSWDRQDGNVDTNRFRTNGHIHMRTENRENLALLEYNFGESQGRVDTDRYLVHLRHAFAIDRPVAGEVYAQLESNDFARLSSRRLAGPGARWRWIQKEKLKVFSGTGVFWSTETLERRPGTTDAGTEDYWRGNFYLSFSIPLIENITLNSVTYYQPDIQRLRDYRILQDTNIEFPVNQLISFMAYYRMNYDNLPPQGVRSPDHFYGTAITLKNF